MGSEKQGNTDDHKLLKNDLETIGRHVRSIDAEALEQLEHLLDCRNVAARVAANAAKSVRARAARSALDDAIQTFTNPTDRHTVEVLLGIGEWKGRRVNECVTDLEKRVSKFSDSTYKRHRREVVIPALLKLLTSDPSPESETLPEGNFAPMAPLAHRQAIEELGCLFEATFRLWCMSDAYACTIVADHERRVAMSEQARPFPEVLQGKNAPANRSARPLADRLAQAYIDYSLSLDACTKSKYAASHHHVNRYLPHSVLEEVADLGDQFRKAFRVGHYQTLSEEVLSGRNRRAQIHALQDRVRQQFHTLCRPKPDRDGSGKFIRGTEAREMGLKLLQTLNNYVPQRMGDQRIASDCRQVVAEYYRCDLTEQVNTKDTLGNVLRRRQQPVSVYVFLLKSNTFKFTS